MNKDKIIGERQKDKALLNTYYLAYLSNSFEPKELYNYLTGKDAKKNKDSMESKK